MHDYALPMETNKTNSVQCLYHWHRPPELMIQMISGVYCSTELAWLYTNMEISSLHVGGIRKAYCKGSYVTLLRQLHNLRPNFLYFFLPNVPCLFSKHIFSTFSYLQLFNFFNISFLGSGSVEGIATAYGLDGPGIKSRCGRDFPHLSRPALKPTLPLVQWVPVSHRGEFPAGE